MFSSDNSNPYRVDCTSTCGIWLTLAIALKNFTDDILASGLQVTSSNTLYGLSGRAALLRRLGSTLEESPAVFTKDRSTRPGYMLGIFVFPINLTPDYLVSHPSTSTFEGRPVVLLPTIWDVLTINLRGIWPEGRTKFQEGARGLGDVWKTSTLDPLNDGLKSLVPFHKLTQWLCYSLIQVLRNADVIIEGENLLTALPEYRNGTPILLTHFNLRRSPCRYWALDSPPRVHGKRVSSLSRQCSTPRSACGRSDPSLPS